jgi:hypothetical protein
LSLDLILSILVLATIALSIGAVVAWRKGARQKAVLMLVLAVVTALNVAILTVPGPSGAVPLERKLD